ncbi:MAG: hypothetical protein OXU61_04265 [Gammaproteobacteria bacterium]|nr:hypothetical protein [Gammaproteobacteria bacterium]
MNRREFFTGGHRAPGAVAAFLPLAVVEREPPAFQTTRDTPGVRQYGYGYGDARAGGRHRAMHLPNDSNRGYSKGQMKRERRHPHPSCGELPGMGWQFPLEAL